jgi:hypothetical protein
MTEQHEQHEQHGRQMIIVEWFHATIHMDVTT